MGGLAISGGDNLHRLNLTILTEEVSEVLVSVGLREALDEQVALLLGVLESLLLSGDLSLSLVLRDGGLHVDLEAIDLLIMEVVDSIGSAGGTVRLIVGLVEADESEGFLSRFSILGVSVLLLHHDAGLDCAEFTEDLLKVSLVPGRVEVLDIDVVVHLTNLSVVLGLVFDDLKRVDILFLNCIHSSISGLEANEAVAIAYGRDTVVNLLNLLAVNILFDLFGRAGNFGGLYWTELFSKVFVKLLSGNLILMIYDLNEDVLLRVGSILVGS